MFLWAGLQTTFCFAVLVQTVATLDAHHDLPHIGSRPDLHTSSDRTTTSEATCALPSPLKPLTCFCDCNNRDCDKRKKALMPCGSVVFYGEQKGLKFCKDDKFYQARCKDQLDCLESIQCFLTCCLQGRGAEYMRRIIRGSEYQVLKLCHPDADPKYQEDFKDMTNCINAVWPSNYKCVAHWHRELSASVTHNGVDIPRFCCSYNDFVDCIYAASDIDCCDDNQRLFFKNVIYEKSGEAYRLLCSDDCYTWDSPKCKCLPPVDNTGQPQPLALEAHLDFARGLTNSSNEIC